MTRVDLFQPTNLEAPQLSSDQIRNLGLGDIKVYSIDDNSAWVGLGDFGEYIDHRYEFVGSNSSNLVFTEVAGRWFDELAFSVTEMWLPWSTIEDFGFGEPLSASGIFAGNDVFTGSWGEDWIFGHQGFDEIYGGGGNDVLWGGEGGDVIWGQGGQNTFLSEADGYWDRLWLQSDGNTDIIYNLDRFDSITIDGVSTSELAIMPVQGGIGIFARGSHEATYIGGNLSTMDIQSMTQGWT